MKYLASLILICIIGIGIFGFTIFNHEMNHQNSGCLAYQIDGVACPTNIIKRALSKTLVTSIFGLFLTIIFLLVISIFSTPPLFQVWPSFKLNPNYYQYKFISWLALLENSPSI